jgi:hypothetical protein
MSIHRATVPQLSKMLRNLDAWIDKGVAHATAKKFDATVLLAARLAPDQYPLLRQVQSACDTAKLTCARLAGKEAPKHPDTEQTVAEVKDRIASVVGYLATFEEKDFAEAADRMIRLSYFPEGQGILGRDYLNDFALPNFYFHVTTAYGILRHSGVELGKMDFIGSIALRPI